ncbi:GAF and ANTAR domain-containing protein [Jatrophihabitans telluris]|uniref:GAF and ANTAR domain-containing protein n=1 Tax=Jatrophihabitans telluris TaxID=2038343 RepID=A0ABY4QZ41_9ACTN|nr:GAF and ANTAR domain-containing protein [Jatrophihabitans telluris]UQX88835.1 GAF and ANTAR domain-containing protein [Jatrophihabitans telluris]
MADLDLAQLFAEMATNLDQQPTVDEALEETVRMAVEAVGSADHAGVSWCVRRREVDTPYATTSLVKELDRIQYELDEGPSLEAFEEGVATLVRDTSTDERFPRYSAAALERGVRSVLSCALSSPRRTIGALNFYAMHPDAFDDYGVELAKIYASHASIVLANRSLEQDLQVAVDTRGTIGQAMGILIERHRISPKNAFDMLVRGSQQSNMKLRDLAAHIVDTGLDPSAV